MKDNDTDGADLGPAKNKGVSHVKAVMARPQGQAVSHVKTVEDMQLELVRLGIGRWKASSKPGVSGPRRRIR